MPGFTIPQGCFRRVVRAPDRISTVLCSACLVCACAAFMAAPARALERVVPDNPSAVVSTDGKTAAAMSDDSCRALLKPENSGAGPAPVPAPGPAAGQTAVIGFVFGLRFALGPTRTTGDHAPSLAIWQPGDAGHSQALAIADYRRCRNEMALRHRNQ